MHGRLVGRGSENRASAKREGEACSVAAVVYRFVGKTLKGTLTASVLVTSTLVHAETRTFAIEAQSLDGVLKAFAFQSNREIFFAPELTRGKRARGINGRYDDLAALTAILADTGLTY